MSQASMPLGGPPNPVALANRRATIRYRCAPATTGKVYSAEDHEFVRAWIMDLSLRGIGMQMARPLALGQHIVIVMRNNANTSAMEYSARVAYCQPLPHDEWHIGGEFTIPLTSEELEQFL